jgi:hypothetical protein
MATEKKVKLKAAEKFPLGHAKENKDAKVYAKNGMSVKASNAPMVDGGEYATNKAAKNVNLKDPLPNGVSFGMGIEKTDGIVTRGNGAATKGLKARGPMA